jgi:hypothetical protein
LWREGLAVPASPPVPEPQPGEPDLPAPDLEELFLRHYDRNRTTDDYPAEVSR